MKMFLEETQRAWQALGTAHCEPTKVETIIAVPTVFIFRQGYG